MNPHVRKLGWGGQLDAKKWPELYYSGKCQEE